MPKNHFGLGIDMAVEPVVNTGPDGLCSCEITREGGKYACWSHAMRRRFVKFCPGHRPGLYLDRLSKLYKLKEGKVVGLNWAGDLADPSVHWNSILKVWLLTVAIQRYRHYHVMPKHKILFLTKKPDRLYNSIQTWITKTNIVDACQRPFIWLGVSIPSADYMWRVEWLFKFALAGFKTFIMFEPLWGPINLSEKWLLERLKARQPETIYYPGEKSAVRKIIVPDQVVVGGQTGEKAKPMEASWAIDIKNQCDVSGVPFWFKQMGTKPFNNLYDLEYLNDNNRLAWREDR